MKRKIPHNYVVDEDKQHIKEFNSTTGMYITNCTATIETDVNKSFYGGNTLKITNPAVNNTNFYVTFPVVLDDAETAYDFAIWLPNTTTITTISVAFTSGNEYFTKEMRIYANPVYLREGWNVYRLTKDKFSSILSETFGNKIKYARISFQIAGEVPFEYILIDTLKYAKKELPNIVFTVDDSFYSARSIIQPYMASKGMGWTLYARLHWQGTGGKLSDVDLKWLYDNGVHIGNHTVNHLNLEVISDSQAEEEIDKATEKLISLGIIKDIDHIAYPFGNYTNHVVQHLKNKGFKTGRTTHIPQPNYACEYSNNVNGMFELRTFIDYSVDYCTLESVRTKINEAYRNGGTIIILIHDIAEVATAAVASISEFHKMIDYIDSLGLKTKSMAEWYRGLTNPRIRR